MKEGYRVWLAICNYSYGNPFSILVILSCLNYYFLQTEMLRVTELKNRFLFIQCGIVTLVINVLIMHD